jgi:transcriptional regulator with XRE-family HTH domain
LKTNIPVDFSSRIKAIRHKLGLTQVRLAELMGVSFASVNRWENGQSRPSALAWRKIERVEVHGYSALTELPLEKTRTDNIDQPDGSVTTNIGPHFAAQARSIESDVSSVPKLTSIKSGTRSFLSTTEINLGPESCDEKIVMAGLYIREMLARGLIQRVLIIAPGRLLHSWELEMNMRFNLAFKLLSVDKVEGNPFTGTGSNLLIVNLDLLAENGVFALLQEPGVKPYDVAILDESHSQFTKNESSYPLRSVSRRQVAEALAGVRMKDKRWQLPWRAGHLLLLSARLQRH